MRWVQTQTITGFDFSEQFNALALGPDYLAIGDAGVDEFRGGVHIYSQTGAGTYAFDSTLTTGNPTAGPGWLLGFSTIASGDTVTSAAPGGQKVHVFVRAGGVWSEQAELTISLNPQYGFSGERILLPQGQVVGQSARVQEFVRTGGVWSAGGELINPQEPEKGVSTPVSRDGARAVASEASAVAPVEDAIAFELGSAGWVATARLRNAFLPECRGFVDVTLAISGRLVVAGCPNGQNGHPAFEGRVEVYDLPQ